DRRPPGPPLFPYTPLFRSVDRTSARPSASSTVVAVGSWARVRSRARWWSRSQGRNGGWRPRGSVAAVLAGIARRPRANGAGAADDEPRAAEAVSLLAPTAAFAGASATRCQARSPTSTRPASDATTRILRINALPCRSGDADRRRHHQPRDADEAAEPGQAAQPVQRGEVEDA